MNGRKLSKIRKGKTRSWRISYSRSLCWFRKIIAATVAATPLFDHPRTSAEKYRPYARLRQSAVVSISLPVSTRQSTHTAKSRGSRGWLKASGSSSLLLLHFPHARSLARPQPGARSILVSLCFFSYSLPRTRFNPLSNLVSTSVRNACECVP